MERCKQPVSFLLLLNILVATWVKDAIISSGSLGGQNVNLPMIMIMRVVMSYKGSVFPSLKSTHF